MLQTDELLPTKKMQTYLISPTSREIKEYQGRLILLTKGSFHFSGMFTGWTHSRLKSGGKQILETGELLKMPKKQTYLKSPTSREKEDFREKYLLFY